MQFSIYLLHNQLLLCIFDRFWCGTLMVWIYCRSGTSNAPEIPNFTWCYYCISVISAISKYHCFLCMYQFHDNRTNEFKHSIQCSLSKFENHSACMLVEKTTRTMWQLASFSLIAIKLCNYIACKLMWHAKNPSTCFVVYFSKLLILHLYHLQLHNCIGSNGCNFNTYCIAR